MRSAASYFSVSLPLIKENMRRYWAIPAISFLVYFLSGVFPLLISYNELDPYGGNAYYAGMYYFIESMLKNHYPMFMAAHLIVPVVTAVVVFRYLQTTASVTSIHAMPFTRAKLFNSNMLSGLILVTIPVFLTGAILLLISKPVYYPYDLANLNSLPLSFEPVNVFARADILNWMWESFIVILVVYAVAVFAGLVTGNSFMHIFAGFGFNFLIPGLFGVFTTYCTQYLYGFTMSSDWNSIALGLSPYLQVFESGGDFPGVLQFLYILNALALFAVCMALYYRRKLERTSDSFVFGFMVPVISYLIAFFGMTMLGFYFEAIGRGEAYFYAGLFSGALIFFLIGRMIVKKTFRIFDGNTARSLGIYLLLAAVFVCSFTLDITGFEKRMPAESRVSAAAVACSGILPPGSGFIRDWSGDGDFPLLASRENIAAITELHKIAVENRPDDEEWETRKYTFNPRVRIKYDLPGFDMHRSYNVNFEHIRDSAALARLFESEEYKSHFRISNADLTDLISIHVEGPLLLYDENAPVIITGKNKMEEFLSRVELDFRAQTYASAISFKRHYANIILTFDHRPGSQWRDASLTIPADFENSIEWLRSNGYTDRREITPEMVSMIVMNKWDDAAYKAGAGGYYSSSVTYGSPVPQPYYYETGGRVTASVYGESVPAVEITDKEQIAAILENYEYTLYTREYYSGSIILEPEFIMNEFDRYGDVGVYFSIDTAPEFVKDMF